MTDYEITSLTQYAAPAKGAKLVAVDPADTTTPPADANGSSKWLTIGQLLGVAEYLFPSGDTSGATDTTKINAVIGNGGVVNLLQAPFSGTPYMVNSPLLPASQSGIRGAQPWSASANDSYGPAGGGASGGTTIYAVAGFTGAAIINMTNPTGTQFYGVSLEDFCIEGFSTGGSGCHGILINGAWGAGFISGVTVHRPDQDCLRMSTNATSGDNPDEWVITRSKFSAARNGYGIWIDNAPDSVFGLVNSSENNLDGWRVNFSTNLRCTDVKSENNGGAGFHLTGQAAGEAMSFVNATTHLNGQDGWFFDNPNGNPGGRYIIDGGFALDDNQNGGTTFSSFRANGGRAAVQVSNYYAAGSAYGAYEGGGSFGMCFTACNLAGTVAAVHDDGTNTHALVNQSPVPF